MPYSQLLSKSDTVMPVFPEAPSHQGTSGTETCFINRARAEALLSLWFLPFGQRKPRTLARAFHS